MKLSSKSKENKMVTADFKFTPANFTPANFTTMDFVLQGGLKETTEEVKARHAKELQEAKEREATKAKQEKERKENEVKNLVKRDDVLSSLQDAIENRVFKSTKLKEAYNERIDEVISIIKTMKV